MSKVFCYRNLMRKGVVWSVRDVSTGLVIDRSTHVVLSNVTLKVSQAGRARVLRDGRKNVHAGIQGKRIKRAPKGYWIRAEYNPYWLDSFVTSGLRIPIKHVKYAKLTPDGLYVMFGDPFKD